MSKALSSLIVALQILTILLCLATMIQAFTRKSKILVQPLRLETTNSFPGLCICRKSTRFRCSSGDAAIEKTSSTMAGWTVREAISESIRRLADKNIIEPDYSAMHLMAASLKLPWERGIRDLEINSTGGESLQSRKLTSNQASEFEAMLQRRENHEPIQYILGQWDFLDYTVSIRKPLLCPRPETEELVMKVVAETTKAPVRILDIGCGTGVIGLSLAELLPNATVEAIDVEPVAINTSRENARRVLKGQERSSDKISDRYRATLVSANDYITDKPFDLIVSNPPYIPRCDIEGLTKDVTRYESDDALCGGTDGMDVIRTIVQRIPEWCNAGAVCWMEVDPSHPKLIEELLASKGVNCRVQFESSHKDMFGNDRFVKLKVV